MKPIRDCHLYGILDLSYVAARDAVERAQQMLAGGVEVLQLRAKQQREQDIVELGKALASLCNDSGVALIINDHPHLVEQIGAQGAHVGQDDISVAAAREAAGAGAIIGKSTHSLSQAKAAAAEGADYIGFGPLFATPTKPDYQPIGLAEVAQVHSQVELPVFCIGGIKLENLPEVLAAGARRVVIVSGILQAPDVSGYVREAKQLLHTPT